MMRPEFIYKADGRVDYPAMRDAANRAGNARLAAKKRAEDAARQAAARRLVEGLVQPAFRPPAGRLWRVDAEARIVIGPKGGIGTVPVIIRTLEALTAPGRHDEAVVAAAGGWRDVDHLREGMTGIAPKLAAIGLRLDRRKVGIRITKVKAQHVGEPVSPTSPRPRDLPLGIE